MRISTIALLIMTTSTACTTKGELGEAKFLVGNNWNSGSIAQGSLFDATAKLPFLQGKLAVRSSDDTILQPINGRFSAEEVGKADLMAYDESNNMVDYLHFNVKKVDSIRLRDKMMEDIPFKFAMLLDTRLQLDLQILDIEGQELLHDNLVEMHESDSRYIRSSFTNAQVTLEPYTYGEERLLFTVHELQKQYRIEGISPTQMTSFSVSLNGHQGNHPNGSNYSSAPYGYEWVEVYVEATSYNGNPVLIPSSELYVPSAMDTWNLDGDINRKWALLSWGEFPMVSLTPPPTQTDSNDSMEIPEHNQ
jgi:hypothetical protein